MTSLSNTNIRIPSTMKAWTLLKQETDLQLKEIEVQHPNAGEILIKVIAVSLNPIDNTLIQMNMTKTSLPRVLGFDVAGTVVEVGRDVNEFKVGDEVCSYIPIIRQFGGFAEYAVVLKNFTVLKKNVDWAQAAALPLAFCTQWVALREVDCRGKTLFVTGTGGLSHFAIQYAHFKGASQIIGCASDSAGLNFLKNTLKVSSCFNFKTADLSQEIMKLTDNRGVDIVFDCTTKADHALQCIHILKKGGVLAFTQGKEKLEDNQNVMNLLKEKNIILKKADLLPYALNPSNAGDIIVQGLKEGIDLISSNKIHAYLNGIPLKFEEIPNGLNALKNEPCIGKKVASINNPL